MDKYGLLITRLDKLPVKDADALFLAGTALPVAPTFAEACTILSGLVGHWMQKDKFVAVQHLGQRGKWTLTRGGVRVEIEVVPMVQPATEAVSSECIA